MPLAHGDEGGKVAKLFAQQQRVVSVRGAGHCTRNAHTPPPSSAGRQSASRPGKTDKGASATRRTKGSQQLGAEVNKGRGVGAMAVTAGGSRK